jgi:hypothetical protein
MPLPLLVAVGLAAPPLLLLPLAVGFLDPPPLLGLSKATADISTELCTSATAMEKCSTQRELS